MDRTQRVALSSELNRLNLERAALNRKRGPLGHGVIYHADLAEKRIALTARIEEIRGLLSEGKS